MHGSSRAPHRFRRAALAPPGILRKWQVTLVRGVKRARIRGVVEWIPAGAVSGPG
jgi:hypothetical protein